MKEGYSTKPGERGVLCEKWIFSKEVKKQNENGKDIKVREELDIVDAGPAIGKTHQGTSPMGKEQVLTAVYPWVYIKVQDKGNR